MKIRLKYVVPNKKVFLGCFINVYDVDTDKYFK